MPSTRLIEVKTEGHKTAIVFIHGFGGDAAKTWEEFPAFLASAEPLHDWDVFSIAYNSNLMATAVEASLGWLKRKFWSRQPPIQVLADELRARFDFKPLSEYQRVAIIAHSMGGLVAQRAILDDGKLPSRVSHLLLFGTPSGGLKTAAAAKKVQAQLADMAECGEFITKLRTEWDAADLTFEFRAVKGTEDVFVPPESSQGPFPCLDGMRFDKSQCGIVPGNHTGMVKPLNEEDECVGFVVARIQGTAAPTGIWSASWEAIGITEAQDTVAKYDTNPADLDKKTRVALALAHDVLGARDRAIEVLKTSPEDDADAMGTLAGRYKRSWRDCRSETQARQALELYQAGYKVAEKDENAEMAYYNGVNVAYMMLAAFDDAGGARKMANEVLDWLAKSHDEDPPWKEATEGEALLYAGKKDEAIQRYRAAIESSPEGKPPRPWMLASMYQQAMSIGRCLHDEELIEAIERLFRGESRTREQGGA